MKEIRVKIMNDYKNHTSTEEKIKEKNKPRDEKSLVKEHNNKKLVK